MLKKIYYPTINFPNGITIIGFIQRLGLFLWITEDCRAHSWSTFPGLNEATFPQVDRHPRGVQNNEGCHDLVAQGWYMLGPA